MQHFELSVLVLNESPIQTIADLQGKSISRTNNVPPALVEQFAHQHNDHIQLDAITIVYDDLSLVYSLFSQSSDAIIINEASRSIYEENYEGFSELTRIITNQRLTQTIKNEANVKNNEPFSILISGIDTNGPIDTVSRSDVNIVVTVNPNTREIFTVSIPRDTWVYMPCVDGYDKLTHSGVFGVECTIDSIEGLLKTEINYYIKLNFTSFINILNIVGDITVNSHYTFVGHRGTQFEYGPNTVDAERALEFARTRKTVEGGDYTRGLHQQEVIKAIFNKLITSVSVSNLQAIIDEISHSLETNMNPDIIASIIQRQIANNTGWSYDILAMTGIGDMRPTALYPNQELWISYPVESELEQAISNITAIKQR